MTVNEQMFVLPEVSMAVQVTVVIPSGKTDPDAGDTFVEVRPQLSVNTGAEKFTTALLWATGTFVVMFAGQVMFGANVYWTGPLSATDSSASAAASSASASAVMLSIEASIFSS